MLTLKKTHEVESTAFPGVRFAVKVLSVAARARADESTETARAEFEDLCAQIRALQPPKQAAEPDPADGAAGPVPPQEPPGQAEARAKLTVRANQVFKARLLPAVVRRSVVSVSGLTLDDGRPATIDDVLESGPDELIYEMHEAAEAGVGLTAVQEKNSPSPTTSPAAGG